MGELHGAIADGNLSLVKKLIAEGADVNASSWSLTPLHMAARSGNREIIETLVGCGARVDARTADGKTALEMVLLSGNEAIASAFLPGEPASWNDPGALCAAVSAGYTDLARAMVELGCDTN